MNTALEAIYGRRSIRKYKKEQISKEELEAILKAGMCAPSARNGQSSIIVVLQNSQEIAYLSKLIADIRGVSGDSFFGAPTVLVVLADKNSPFAAMDGSLVMGNMMNAASALGIGSCWINRAREVFDSDEGKALLEKWGVEGEYIGIGNCILGYPDEAPKMKPRKEKYVYYTE